MAVGSVRVYTDAGGYETGFKAFGKTRDGIGRNIREALEKCAQMVFKESQRLVPVRTGALKASGKIEDNGKQGLAAEFAVVYTAPYAVYVHERVDIPHTPPTQSKYIEAAVNKLRGSMTALVRRQVGVRRS